jgi:hypothetical protein
MAPRIDTKFIEFTGGLDTETSKYMVKPGRVRESRNVYQGINGGYTWCGYERFSGRPKPSEQIYLILPTTLTGSVTVGDTVTDDDASGSLKVVANLSSYLVCTRLSGAFDVGDIRVGGVVVGSCSSEPSPLAASTKLLNAQYLNLAADDFRDDILAPTGSGGILGVWFYKDNWYCWRNNAGGTAVDMWKATASGWSQVPLGKQLAFTSGGTYQIQDGDTVVGEISGAIATVGRVAHRTGSWAAGDAAGVLVFQSQTGTFQSETLRVGSSLDVATISGDSSDITIANPGGRFDVVNGNFTGSFDTQKMYGCDGRNPGFEFDGTNFVPIETGITNTYPTHVVIHKQQLFFSFLGSVQHSQPGLPYQWTLVLGSGEIGMGDIVTGMQVLPGDEGTGALGIFTISDIGILYGSNISDWNLVNFQKGLGGIEWTHQTISDVLFLDNRGITKLSAAQSFGNFTDATLSFAFKRALNVMRTQVSCSAISKEKNLYMLFNLDNTAMFCTIVGGKLTSGMEMMFENSFTCACTADDDNGSETVMLGGADGYVYEMFRGTSFDGDDISWYFNLVYDSLGSPTHLKRVLFATIEVEGNEYSSFQFGASSEWNSQDFPQPDLETREFTLSGSFWDGFYWDLFYWDGQNLSPEKFPIMGMASNFGFKFAGSSDYTFPLSFKGMLIQYYLTKSTR